MAGKPESVQRLTSNDLGTVLEEVVDVSAQWYSLGLQLRVNVGALDRIRAQFSDPQDQLSAMLKAWLNSSSCHLSWGNLISALRSRTMQANQLASQLERKYGLLLHGRGEAEGSSTAAGGADVPPASVPEQSDTPMTDPPTPNQDVLEIGNFVQEALLAFDRAFTGQTGEIDIHGRRIKFKAKCRVHSFKEPLVWDATAQDMETGIKVKAKHSDTDKDANRFAIRKLCTELRNKGILHDALD